MNVFHFLLALVYGRNDEVYENTLGKRCWKKRRFHFKFCKSFCSGHTSTAVNCMAALVQKRALKARFSL